MLCKDKMANPWLYIQDVKYKTQKKKFGFKKFYDQKQKAHIMLKEQCKCNAWQCLTKL